MEEKRKYLDISNQKTKVILDPCPVCSEELFYDEDVTKRMGVLGKYNEIEGWLCPFCRSTFDKKDKLLYIKGVNSIQGKA